MTDRLIKRRRRFRLGLRALAAAVIYFGIAVLWFALFERVATQIATTPEQAKLYKGLVGLFFVIASAFGASGMVWHALRKRHRIQDALQQSQAQLAKLVDSALDAIISIDAGRRIVVFNPAAQAMFGCVESDARGRDVRLFIPEFAENGSFSASWDLGKSNGRLRALKCRRLDTSEFSAEASIARRAEGGDPFYTLVVRDVTDRIRLEEQLRLSHANLEQRVVERTSELQAVNRELESFCYSVAHDLRAPLRCIQSFAGLLKEEAPEALNEFALNYVARIEGAAQRMDQLIDAWLNLSRIARGEIRWEQIDLGTLATAVIAELRQVDPKREVEFVCPAELTVRGDPRLFHLLLQNLLGNAWKFTANLPRARIELGVQRREGGTPIYFVRDDGAGFDMKQAGALFQPFQRLHAGTEYQGTGIGLATCQKIILRHGGCIWAEAQVNQGATFYFSLPERAG